MKLYKWDEISSYVSRVDEIEKEYDSKTEKINKLIESLDKENYLDYPNCKLFGLIWKVQRIPDIRGCFVVYFQL